MSDLVVFNDGVAHWQGEILRCAVGKNGVTPEAEKREGDLKTPAGRYPLRCFRWRADRMAKPHSCLPGYPIGLNDKWCEDVEDPENYNRLIQIQDLPGDIGLWRDAEVFDLLVVIGHNDDPPVPGRGSGIFLHLMRDNYSGSEGCVTFSREDMIHIVESLTPDTHVDIRPYPSTEEKASEKRMAP